MILVADGECEEEDVVVVMEEEEEEEEGGRRHAKTLARPFGRKKQEGGGVAWQRVCGTGIRGE